MSLPSTTDVLIVGGGLSGLRLADLLHEDGCDFQLIEARDRFGGRVLGQSVGGQAYDLGPAWFWPGQPRIAALAARFDLSVFDQYASGAFRYEDAQGRIQQGYGAGSMQGSLRVSGGLSMLSEHLADTLPSARCHLGAQLDGVTRTDMGVTAHLANGHSIAARRIVCALPPRLVAKLTFTPPLPQAAASALQTTPTWMAGHAKAVAVYDTPFWRDAGLSGDAMSQRGPMVEIHDASPKDGQSGALFGFMGVPPAQRRDVGALTAAVEAQLVRLFGPDATSPRKIEIKDWAFDPMTATSDDHAPLAAHPRYGMPSALRGLWDGTLLVGGTETASEFGGFLEGALEAAETAFQALVTPAA